MEELTALLVSHLMKVDYDTLNRDNIQDFIGPECSKIVGKILDYLNENYFIDTENDEFVVKFNSLFTFSLKYVGIRARK